MRASARTFICETCENACDGNGAVWPPLSFFLTYPRGRMPLAFMASIRELGFTASRSAAGRRRRRLALAG